VAEEELYADLPEPAARSQRQGPRWLLVGGGTLLVCMGVLAVLIPNFTRHSNSPNHLGSCTGNLKNLATALEMYASDHGGAYPTDLARLVLPPPGYLNTLPTCPAAPRGQEHTYIYRSSARPDNFTLFCHGDYHQAQYQRRGVNLPTIDFPQYTAEQGLIDRPGLPPQKN
jgi:hypothetical protein